MVSVLLFGLAVLMAACPAKKARLKTGKKYAKAWKAKYGQYFDDELDARRLVHLRTDEPWAQKERKLLEGRVRYADIVLEGTVSNVANMERWDGSKRLAVLVQVTRILRGHRKDLPEGKEQVSLFLSKEHPEVNPKELVGKTATVFLRWRPKGSKPPFRWHGNFVCREIVADINKLLQKRAVKELKNQ